MANKVPSVLTDYVLESRYQRPTPKLVAAVTPIDRFRRRLAGLRSERSSWLPHYQDLSGYIQPRRGRFLTDEANKGDKKNSLVINSTATLAARTLSSGMMSGLTSPSRPWFKLTTSDLDMMDNHAVKEFLAELERRIYTIFAKSNLYNSFPMVYDELGLFGTAPMFFASDDVDVIRTSVFTAGEYSIANDQRGMVRGVYREIKMSVDNAIGEFGYESASTALRDAYDAGAYDAWVDVIHAVEINDKSLQLGQGFANDQPFRSVYFEASNNENQFLQARGHRIFPILTPRWHLTGTDVYGRSPGMDALGDVKMLQQMERTKLQLLDKVGKPPMVAGPEMKQSRASLLPGDVTYTTFKDGKPQFAPAYQIDPRFNEIRQDIAQTEGRIRSAFYADLFLMLSQLDNRQMTATEVAERHEEKLLALGPVLERLNDEFLDPLIDNTVDEMAQRQLLPEAPPDLQGQELRVEYISILAQAQRAVSTTSVERVAAFAGNIAAVKPEVLDKLDFDVAIEEYGTSLGVNPRMIVPDDRVKQIRANRAKAQSDANAKAVAPQLAQGAKVLSEAKTSDGRSILDRMTGG